MGCPFLLKTEKKSLNSKQKPKKIKKFGFCEKIIK